MKDLMFGNFPRCQVFDLRLLKVVKEAATRTS